MAEPAAERPPRVEILGVTGLPEVREGDDLAALIVEAAARQGTPLQDGDVLVVTQKVVSKAEGRLVDLRTVTPSAEALDLAARLERDPRLVEVILRESVRVVRAVPGVLITETRHGFVCASAAVDASNVPGEEVVCLLPEDPDASADRIREGVRRLAGVDLAVLISDTFGRPWREGQTNVAVGVSGLLPLADYTGQHDPFGYELKVTKLAVADELASASELVMGKTTGVPVAVIRGYRYPAGEGRYRHLLRDPERDLFR
ncbi:MAG TPA: coenzyme F420-0:L-glutamate ligase [Dehalococcoidia bacterium]